MSRKLITLSLLTAFSFICNSQLVMGEVSQINAKQIEAMERTFKRAVTKKGIVTAGVGIIKDGKLVWTGYYGEQRPGVPASSNTQFDVASITKTVATETILKLVQQGKVDLDESMAPYWVDPDIATDPRHKLLTPRMALTHTTGFLNWRFFSDDLTLRLVNDPGTIYGYSGEGFEYLAKYAENKLGKTFEDLVIENIFKPLGIRNASFSARKANFPNIARAITEEGEVPGYYCRPGGRFCRIEGESSAADDLVITVEAYAKFLISIINADQYDKALVKERNQVWVGKGKHSVVDCRSVPSDQCPKAQGYGLGWVVLDFDDEKVLMHGGSDWSEVAVAYFYEGSKDGVIIFLNAPNKRALGAMHELILSIDPDSPIAAQYKRWYKNT